MDQQTVNLTPRGSYGFGLVLAYLRSSPSAIVERVTDHGFQRALDIGPGVVVQVERRTLFPSSDPLSLTIWGEDLTAGRVDETIAYMRRMLCLDEDGAPIEHHLRFCDRALGHYIQQYRGFRPILLGSPWEALLWAIAGQLIGVGQARVIKKRLVKAGGRAVRIGQVDWPLPPDPGWVVDRGVDALRKVGLSRAKADAMVQAEQAVALDRLDLSPEPSHTRMPASLKALEAIPGIGPWTTAMVALLGYGDLDTLPVGDAGLQSIVAQHSTPPSSRLSADGLRERGIQWAPYRGWATYLWWLQHRAEILARKAETAEQGGVCE